MNKKSDIISNKLLFNLPLEDELKLSHFIINHITQLVFCLGENAQFIYVNKAMCDLTEYSHQELLSMNFSDLDIDFLLDHWLAQWENMKKSQCIEYKSRCRTKQRQIFSADINLAYIKAQSTELWCGFIQDNSNELIQLGLKKWIEGEKNIVKKDVPAEMETISPDQRSEIKSHLLATICHQLRTPLNVIYLANSLIYKNIDEHNKGKISPFYENIKIGTEEINQILDDMLTTTNIDSGSNFIDNQRTNLINLCQKIIQNLLILETNKQIDLYYHGNYLEVWIDPKITETILTKLLDNALKYSPHQSMISCLVYCEQTQITFEIKDQGIGIYDIDQEKIFQPFYRGRNVDKIPGNGIGLSIVKNLIDLQGGTISVVSEVGMGTVFTVVIPLLLLIDADSS